MREMSVVEQTYLAVCCLMLRALLRSEAFCKMIDVSDDAADLREFGIWMGDGQERTYACHRSRACASGVDSDPVEASLCRVQLFV